MRYPESVVVGAAVGAAVVGVVGLEGGAAVGPPRFRLSPEDRTLPVSPLDVTLCLGGSPWVGVFLVSAPVGVFLLLLLPPGGRLSGSAGPEREPAAFLSEVLDDLEADCEDFILLAGKKSIYRQLTTS